MEAQIKEEADEPEGLCFVTSGTDGDNLDSLSLVEKYDRFLENGDDDSDVDSDGDFFPNYTMLKEELKNGTNVCQQTKHNHRLSTGLPPGDIDGAASDEQSRKAKDGMTSLNELIERLGAIRRCSGETDGNSIFCSEEELECIQERYGEILDFLQKYSSNFERRSSPKDHLEDDDDDDDDGLGDQEQQRQVRETNNGEEYNGSEKNEEFKLLDEKIGSVRRARDRFYEIEQQVREQLDQLELAERYKMESAG